MTQTTPTKGLIALAVATLVLLGGSFLINSHSNPILPVIIIVAGIQSMVVFAALMWALSQSNRAFFSVFMGDALLRMLSLGIVVAWVWMRHLPFTAPLLTLAFAFLLLSFVQIPFFQRAK